MKNFLTVLFTTCLLLQAQPAAAATWVENVVDWFSEFFSTTATDTESAVVNVDSLRASPLGVLLNAVPDRDTLAINRNWPYESVDAEADLDRYNRLLRKTVLLTNPNGKLPLTSEAIRVIYREGRRPAYLLDMLIRFTDVQEIVFNQLVPEVIAVSDHLPTIIVADEYSTATHRNWYLSLTELQPEFVTLLHFGQVESIAGVPAEWSVINTPLQAKESESFLAQALFGAETIDGWIDRTSPLYTASTGYRLSGNRPGFRMPEQMGIDRLQLEKVDYEINRGIRYLAMPGAQLVVMKNGQVVYEKAYGHQTYRKQPVTNGDLYDLASVTKAAATSLAVMKLFDQGRLKLEGRVRDYVPDYKKSIVGRYRIDQLLTHQTGLQANMPLGAFMTRELVADSLSFANRLPFGPGKWLDGRLPAWVRKTVGGNMEYTAKPTYLYSDVNYYLLQQVVEAISGEPLDQFMAANYYRPMGLGHLAFNPHAKYPEARLVPTIFEPWMRGGLLRGYVHDEGAAMVGGVSGHAGLFSNAHDLGQLFQLLNKGGTYNGNEYLSPATVATFTDHSRYNYRALGFDRLAGRLGYLEGQGPGNGTVGHLGFTGTSVWADPENDLVFVLLTNRVNPDPKNEKFIEMDIRGRVNRAVYQSLNTYRMES